MPVDDKIFDNITNAQWLWYFYNLQEDDLETFNIDRDLVEYNASFVNPEAVKKIRDARENAVRVSDKDFMEGVNKMFGRKIDIDNSGQSETTKGSLDAIDVIKNYKKPIKKIENVGLKNYKDWVLLKLE